MSTNTPNYNLLKPDPTDFVDEDIDLNNNWDIVDTALDGLQTDVDTRATVAALTTETTNRTNADNALDARVDDLEGIIGTDSGWIAIGGAGNGYATLAMGNITDIASKFRRVGDVVQLLIDGTWVGGNITPSAGGNIADQLICNVYQGLPSYVTTYMVFTGVVGANKYIATFLFDVDNNKIYIAQVDSNDEGNIVNGDHVIMSGTWLAG